MQTDAIKKLIKDRLKVDEIYPTTSASVQFIVEDTMSRIKQRIEKELLPTANTVLTDENKKLLIERNNI